MTERRAVGRPPKAPEDRYSAHRITLSPEAERIVRAHMLRTGEAKVSRAIDTLIRASEGH